MTVVRFHVPGTPQGKGRPRASRQGGNIRLYTPSATVAYEGLIGLYGGEAMAGRELIAGPVHLVVTATFPIPASWSKKKKTAAEAGLLWHTAKPDSDNTLKAVGDGCNGIVWKDDSQISCAKITKQYGDRPGLDILVEALSCPS